MVQGAARAAIYSSYRVLKGLLLCYYAIMRVMLLCARAGDMAYSIRRVDSHYGPRARGSPPIPSRYNFPALMAGRGSIAPYMALCRLNEQTQ